MIEKPIVIINVKRSNCNIITFILVFIYNPSQYKTVVQTFEKISEILESYFTTGNHSLLLKVLCKDNEHLMETLNIHIQRIPWVVRRKPLISLEQKIQRQIKV
ncbi:MAG: Lrp/AsnC ligand binding domain-containing protein [Flavobacteriales bacterium]